MSDYKNFYDISRIYQYQKFVKSIVSSAFRLLQQLITSATIFFLISISVVLIGNMIDYVEFLNFAVIVAAVDFYMYKHSNFNGQLKKCQQLRFASITYAIFDLLH